MSFHKITIIGNLGRDPELRYTPQGTPVCNFSVAANEKWRDSSGETQERTTWFRIAAWRRLAEVANQYLKKGSQVYVEGRLSVREYTDRDGVLRTSLEVTASDIQFLGGRPIGSDQEVSPEFSQAEEPSSSLPSDDDVPF